MRETDFVDRLLKLMWWATLNCLDIGKQVFFLRTHKSKASYLVNEPKLLQRATLLTYPEELKNKDKS